MNCTSARNRLLHHAEPGPLPANVAGHLAECAGCQAWQRLLVQVDQAVATAPVPASNGRVKRRLIELFRNERSAVTPPATSVVVPARSRMRQRLGQLWPIGLVAAALLVGTIAWINLGGKPPDNTTAAQLPPDPFLKDVVAAKVKIDAAETAEQRLRAWSHLAEILHAEAKDLSQLAPGPEMDSLAGLYEQAVGDDALIAQARLLSDVERKAKLDQFVNQLRDAADMANDWAAKAPTGSDHPLKRIANAAAESKAKLAKLQQGRDV